MAGSDKSTKASGLMRSSAAARPDSDQTDPNAHAHAVDRADDELTLAGDADELMVAAAGDKTQVYDANAARRSGAEFKLLVVAGPKAGAEFTLSETVMTCGRSPDNHLPIPDVSVSRKHVRFTRLGDDGFTVEDLGSGNGTAVNGDTIQGPVPVKHGDEIALGDTRLQFVEVGVPVVKKKPAAKVDPDATRVPDPLSTRAIPAAKLPAARPPPPAAPAPQGSLPPGRLRLYVAVGAVLGVLLAGAAVLKKPSDAAQAESGEADEAAQQGLEEQIEEATRAGLWAEVEKLLKPLAEASDDRELQEKYAHAKRSAEAQRHLAEAQAALKDGRFVEAQQALSKISKKTEIYDAGSKLAESMNAEAARVAGDARAALTGNDRERAALLADRVLAFDPQNGVALAVRQELDKTDRRAGGARKAGADAAGASGSARVRRSGGDAPQEAEAPAPAPSRSSTALAFYLQGDLGNALRAAEQSNDPLLKPLKAFDAAYRDGIAKAQSNRSAEAVKSLATAMKADRDITKGKTSKPGIEVGKALGNQEYLLGLDCKGDDQLARQAAHFRAAIDADDSTDLYKKAFDKAIQKAVDLYTQAYVARATAPDEARRLFRVACEALPANHEKHERACNFYTQLGGK